MTTSGKLSIPSMKERCSKAEWHARVDLAACYRLVDLYGTFAHGVFRSAALLKWAIEQRLPSPLKLSED